MTPHNPDDPARLFVEPARHEVSFIFVLSRLKSRIEPCCRRNHDFEAHGLDTQR
jgi:hypothetical protein